MEGRGMHNTLSNLVLKHGGKVMKHMDYGVTHLIFLNGSVAIKKEAEKRRMMIITPDELAKHCSNYGNAISWKVESKSPRSTMYLSDVELGPLKRYAQLQSKFRNRNNSLSTLTMFHVLKYNS
jgi:hypothetical protein